MGAKEMFERLEGACEVSAEEIAEALVDPDRYCEGQMENGVDAAARLVADLRDLMMSLQTELREMRAGSSDQEILGRLLRVVHDNRVILVRFERDLTAGMGDVLMRPRGGALSTDRKGQSLP